MSGDLTALAADAYVYGFPLVTNLREVKKFTRDGLGSLPPAPFNSYLARALAARAGLWGNHGYEAAYAVTFTDADGDRTRATGCRPRRAVPAHRADIADIPATGGGARRQLPAPAHHESDSLTSA
jgi:hypothetical protein